MLMLRLTVNTGIDGIFKRPESDISEAMILSFSEAMPDSLQRQSPTASPFLDVSGTLPYFLCFRADGNKLPAVAPWTACPIEPSFSQIKARMFSSIALGNGFTSSTVILLEADICPLLRDPHFFRFPFSSLPTSLKLIDLY